ncbi:carboxypeptidase M32 [Roseicyclus sp. F158]|uniref:Metal-dependent carboxypeptidase n=1 Tax=Tropicimonas omnivorans TaxID=3075590 RepID=A0ABU3DJN0_9RHOB|nr:carboxypeptidase M32 [Roseicyclus sp. F158]MDT0683926.1 carboxypeptidase M32 [Roseicyclus sp. F158]
MSYDAMMAFVRETRALSEVQGRLGWDQETMMPRGAAAQRAEEMAAMESVLHARRSDPRLADWLADAVPEGDVQEAQIRQIRRDLNHATRVPAALSAELARVTSLSQGIWAEAREASNFNAFAPTLQKVVALRRQEAEALADGGDPYDALLDLYEPGATAGQLDEMFGALRPRLVALRDRIVRSERQAPVMASEIPEDVQMKLTAEVATGFGYDMTRGRIDRSVHPFSSGSGLDVRITTRISPDAPLESIYSTIHEVGHAAYEQQVDPAYLLTPIGGGASMGVHESQSRLFENQLGRSAAFTSWLFGRLEGLTGTGGLADARAFYAAANRVAPGHIRTEADEVHYNLHILMRFDLERELIAGRLAVADLPEAWNTRFARDFGLDVRSDAQGVLQDVHWSLGLFGYFPTYTLGNVYAGCLHAAMRRDLPELDSALAAGSAAPATDWLAEKVRRHGGLHAPRDLIERATGAPVSEEPLLAYLEEKFGALYGF